MALQYRKAAHITGFVVALSMAVCFAFRWENSHLTDVEVVKAKWPWVLAELMGAWAAIAFRRKA